ncbi:hypothetical protein D3C74_472590 [compost metagenome]
MIASTSALSAASNPSSATRTSNTHPYSNNNPQSIAASSSFGCKYRHEIPAVPLFLPNIYKKDLYQADQPLE